MQPGGCGAKSRAPADGVGVSTFRKCVKDGERKRKRSGGLVSSPSEEFTHEFVSDLWETLEQTSHSQWKCQQTHDLLCARIPDTGALLVCAL